MATATAAPGQTAQPAPLLGVTRAGIALLLLLAVANGAFLYFLPGQAASHYAWPLMPRINAAALGAGYLAGMIATTLALRARWWRSVTSLLPGFIALALVAVAATILHEDRFRWDYVLTFVWTVVYAGLPPAIAFLWWRQQRVAPPAPPRDPAVRIVAAVSLALGVVLGALALALLVAPVETADRWPWPITPLVARVLAAWYALAAGTLLFSAASARAMHELIVPFVTVGAWSALLLTLPALYGDSVDSDGAAFAAWLALHALTLALCVWVTLRAGASMRARGEHI